MLLEKLACYGVQNKAKDLLERLLQKKALIFFKSLIAHTEPLLKIMNQLKLSDLYIINLLKLYYKLYRNRLPTYFECFFARIWRLSA